MAEAELLVCVKCRRGLDLPGEARRPGRVLADRVAAGLPDGVRLTEVECFANCEQGCTIALRGPGRWTFVYGNLTEADAEIVTAGAARYAGAPDGLVPWRERPLHFRRNCIARIPPLPEATNG
jgi:predicted metal-binding protein